VPLGRFDRCYCRASRAKRASSDATSHLGCGAPPASAAQRSDSQKSPEPDDQWTAANARPSAVENFNTSDLGCGACLSAQARIEQLRSSLGGATRWALRAQRAAGDLRIRLLTALTTTPSRSIPPPPSCPEFLEALRRCALRNDQNGPALQAIAATILLPGSPPEPRLKWDNGVECVYVRQRATTKPVVGRSQRYKRLASGLKSLIRAVGADSRDAVRAGAVTVSTADVRRLRIRQLSEPSATSLSPEQQLGLIAAYGISFTGFKGILRGIGGFRLGLSSLPVLRTARQRLAGLPAKKVAVMGSGAHLVSLKGAVQENLDALWASGSFVEKLLRDSHLVPIAQTHSYEVPSIDAGSIAAASPPQTVKDIHVTLGVDKGGTPASVKIVAGLVNQRRPHRLRNTIFVGVCPSHRDDYDALSSMLGEHLDQVAQLVREGVVVGGERRAVRLIMSGDYEALCTVHGHKGQNATMACLMCYCTRSPSRTQAALDGIYGTMQDVDAPAPAHARTSAHLVSMAARAGGPANDQLQAALRSIARPPLFSVDPRQIVPIPWHILLGITLRLLRLAIELVISCRGRPVGSAFAFEVAETLRRVVRGRPAPYHGGVFIGRDCHANFSTKRRDLPRPSQPRG